MSYIDNFIYQYFSYFSFYDIFHEIFLWLPGVFRYSFTKPAARRLKCPHAFRAAGSGTTRAVKISDYPFTFQKGFSIITKLTYVPQGGTGPAKHPSLGPVAQLGAHYIRIVGVGSSNLLRSTISGKITANSAVIFRLTTIIPQTGIISDHFAKAGAVSVRCSPPLNFAYL